MKNWYYEVLCRSIQLIIPFWFCVLGGHRSVTIGRQRREMITPSLFQPESCNTLHPVKTHTGHAASYEGIYTTGEITLLSNPL